MSYADTQLSNETVPPFWQGEQQKFYDWTRRVGLDATSIPGYPFVDTSKAPTFWSREQFNLWLSKNPTHPQRWAYEIGSRRSPITYGGTNGRTATFFDGANVLKAAIFIIPAFLMVPISVFLSVYFSPVFIVLALVLPGYGLYNKFRSHADLSTMEDPNKIKHEAL